MNLVIQPRYHHHHHRMSWVHEDALSSLHSPPHGSAKWKTRLHNFLRKVIVSLGHKASIQSIDILIRILEFCDLAVLAYFPCQTIKWQNASFVLANSLCLLDRLSMYQSAVCIGNPCETVCAAILLSVKTMYDIKVNVRVMSMFLGVNYIDITKWEYNLIRDLHFNVAVFPAEFQRALGHVHGYMLRTPHSRRARASRHGTRGSVSDESTNSSTSDGDAMEGEDVHPIQI